MTSRFTLKPIPLIQSLPIRPVGAGVTPIPLYTLNSFLAGSLFLPAMLETKILNSYLDPPSSPVTLYSWASIFFLVLQCTYFPSGVSLLYSTSYLSSGSPPSWGGRVHLSVKLELFNHVAVLVISYGPLGGPSHEKKRKAQKTEQNLQRETADDFANLLSTPLIGFKKKFKHVKIHFNKF